MVARKPEALLRSPLRIVLSVVAALVVLVAASCPLQAADATFSGTFTSDDDQRSFFFTLSSPGTVVLRTTSYASGGFDPTLSVFDSFGDLIATNTDGGCGNVPAKPGSGVCWDAFLSLPLPPGSYRAVLTQSANVPSGPGLTDSFIYQGQPNFTAGPQGSSQFMDVSGAQNSSSFSLSVQSVDSVVEQLNINNDAPPAGKVTVPYSFQFGATGGVAPYTWSVTSGALPTGLTLSPTTGALTGTPTAPGPYSFTVNAVDSASKPFTDSHDFQISIAPQDLQITTAAIPNWVPSAPLNLNLAAIGGYPPYTWSLGSESPIAGVTVTSGGLLSATPSATGVFSVPVRVTDSHENTVSAGLNWTVNPALSITAAALPPATTSRSYFPVILKSSGGANTSIVWSVAPGALPSGMTLSTAGVLQGVPTSHGTFAFTAQASDGVLPAQQAFTLSVYDPLTITSSSLPGASAGIHYGPINLTATGGSGAFNWSAAGLPPGLLLSSNGQISGTPGVGGSYNVSIVLTDTSAGQTANSNLSLTVAYPPITISGGGSIAEVAVGAAVSLSFSASGGKPPYAWSGTGLPPGLTINASTGLLGGTVTQAGNFVFLVEATDAQNNVKPATVALAILGLNPGSLPNAVALSPYSQSFSAAGGAPPYTFSASGLPTGLSMSPFGTLSGSPQTPGSYPFSVRASDTSGVSSSLNFSVTVVPAVAINPFGTTLSAGTVNVPYSTVLTSSGGTPPYAWTVLGGTVPPGLTLSDSGTLSGTPNIAGGYSFTFQTTDTSGGKAAGTASITISPPALTVSGIGLPDGINGSDYFAQIITPVGGLPPYTVSIKGALPDGLALTDGQITGTPTANGTFSFTIQVSDANQPPDVVSTAAAILIKSPRLDLLLASASAAFSISPGQTSLPAPAVIGIRSSVAKTTLSYTATLTTPASWLTVTSGGSTPGSISIALNSAAGALPISNTPYQATVTVTCTAPDTCTGSQTIAVSLSVASTPPQLLLPSPYLDFALTAPVKTSTHSFELQNIGGGSLTINSITPADSWLTVSGVPSAIPAGPSIPVTANVDVTGLQPGVYRSTITVSSSAGIAAVPVSLLYTLAGSISLSPSGAQVSATQGVPPSNSGGSFLIPATGGSTLHWTAAVQPPVSWLKISNTSGISTPSTPGQVNYSIDPAAAAALAAQPYYATIEVASPDSASSPFDFEVILDVAPSLKSALPDPEPAGLAFVATLNGAAPPAETVTVYTNSSIPTQFQAAATTTDGANWLTVAPQLGLTSAGSPAQTTITVNQAGLAPGAYSGTVSYALSSAAVRSVNISLVVLRTPGAPASGASPSVRKPFDSTSACAATRLVPTQTGLVSNFAQPAAWPTLLLVKLIDDCGSAVTNGQIVATFSNGDPPLSLLATDSQSGLYGGTWTPRNIGSQITVSARASAAGLPPATTLISGQVRPNAAPLLTPGATLHVFDPLVGGALGPGNIVQIYGSNLAAQTTVAPSIPLPTSLAGTSVIIGGIQAPLYFVSPGQINAQIPFELSANHKYQILINANNALTTPDSVQLANASPGIAAFPSGAIIAQHLDGTLITETSPAKPSEIIVFYMAGLGLTDNPVTTGAASPGTVLARPVDPLSLTLDSQPVPILFGGLTPGLVGLYQVNFQIPATAADGDLLLIVKQGDAASNETVLPVRR